MEVRRERLGGRQAGTGRAGAPVNAEELRIRHMSARKLLRGTELEGPNHGAHMEGGVLETGRMSEQELERHVAERVLTTTLDKAVAWARSNAFFPLGFGLACCAMEFFHTAGPRMDMARFGYEAVRASPRQADLIILSGRVSIKMAPIVRRLYDQMLEPKWAISMGACCSSMGVFNNYALVPADKFLPVDVHVPGCPPRPEALMHGILKLRKMVQEQPDASWRSRYDAIGTEERPSATGMDGSAANDGPEAPRGA